MAGLATHRTLAPHRFERVGLGLVRFLKTGVMAPRAHRVPCHATTGPVPPITRFTSVFTENMKPLAKFRIPRGITDLQSPGFNRNKELPQGCLPNRAQGIPIAQRTVNPSCFPCKPLVGIHRNRVGRRPDSKDPRWVKGPHVFIQPDITLGLGMVRRSPLGDGIGMAFPAALGTRIGQLCVPGMCASSAGPGWILILRRLAAATTKPPIQARHHHGRTPKDRKKHEKPRASVRRRGLLFSWRVAHAQRYYTRSKDGISICTKRNHGKHRDSTSHLTAIWGNVPP